MLASTACFVANVLLIRALGEYESANIWLLSVVRFVVGLAVVTAIYHRELRFTRVFQSGRLAGRGIVGGAGVYAYYLTVVKIGAGRATFINNTYVIFGALLAVWMLRERFRRALAVGSIAALAGLALLTNAFGAHAHASAYDLLAVASAFGSAYVVVTIRQLHAEGEHTATIFAAQCAYGLLICALPAAFAVGISLNAWTLMFVGGVFAAGGQIAMTRAFRDLPVAEGSLLQMLVPLGIAIGGFAFFGEHFAPHELIGAALILAGTTFTAIRR
jgi:drug/metabolite transporter (DMT)-like permease